MVAVPRRVRLLGIAIIIFIVLSFWFTQQEIFVDGPPRTDYDELTCINRRTMSLMNRILHDFREDALETREKKNDPAAIEEVPSMQNRKKDVLFYLDDSAMKIDLRKARHDGADQVPRPGPRRWK